MVDGVRKGGDVMCRAPSQLMAGCRSLQQELDSLRASSAANEHKAQQKVSELLEERRLDHQAKAHLEESYQLSLEEKEEKISVLQTQVPSQPV